MSHEIWGEKFVAVRVPAWHGIGQVFENDVLPSAAAVSADLLYGVDKFPLTIQTDHGPLDTGMVMVGRISGDTLVNYGISNTFDLVMLQDVLPNLDDLSTRYPLSAAGALRKGAECFFTFEVSGESEIAGEQYKEYLTVLHSYTPGVAHKFMYSPVRVVCQNTLIASEASATGRVSVSHSAKSRERLDAGYIISDAMARAAMVKKNLELLAKTPISPEAAKAVIENTYARYRPTNRLDTTIMDLVGEDTIATLLPKNESQQRYFANLCATAEVAYDVFNQEYPKVAGTAYALYQAVVEVADHRKGRSVAGSLESAMVGAKAAEKRAAWELLMDLTA